MRKILDEYEQARSFYETNKSAPAGELHGLWTAVLALAEAYGIEVET